MVAGVELGHPRADLLCGRKAVEQVELGPRFQEPLLLVLAVHVDEVIAEALQQPHRHRRVVDERAVAPGARELSADHQLAVLGRQPRRVQDGRDPRIAVDVEHGFHHGHIGVRPDHVGLGSRAPNEENRVDKDGFAGAGLAGEDVEPRFERNGRRLDDRDIADPQLA